MEAHFERSVPLFIMEKPDVEVFDVQEGGYKMQVFIPKSDDPSYDRYLKEAETEKTRDELKRKPPKKQGNTEALTQSIRERIEFKNREKNHENTKRFW